MIPQILQSMGYMSALLDGHMSDMMKSGVFHCSKWTVCGCDVLQCCLLKDKQHLFDHEKHLLRQLDIMLVPPVDLYTRVNK